MADHLYFAWFMLDDRPWVEHECLDGEVLVWSPPNPPWRVTEAGGIAPSFDCERCGKHVVLGPADRCDTPEGLEYARCLDPTHIGRPNEEPCQACEHLNEPCDDHADAPDLGRTAELPE